MKSSDWIENCGDTCLKKRFFFPVLIMFTGQNVPKNGTFRATSRCKIIPECKTTQIFFSGRHTYNTHYFDSVLINNSSEFFYQK